MKISTVTPFRRKGRNDFYISFRHPVTKKQINRSLHTADANERAIALDVERMMLNSAAWNILDPVLASFLPAAVLAFHGLPPQISDATIPLPQWAVKSIALAADLPVDVVLENSEATDLRTQLAAAKQTITEKDREIYSLRQDLERYRRRENADVTATLGAAAAEWERDYSRGRAVATIKDTVKRVHEFVEFIGASTPLRNVKGGTIDAWLETFRQERTVEVQRRRTVESVKLPALDLKQSAGAGAASPSL